ncbi:fasciclin domain-containing protein [Terrimonas pollutisoli]|uniref:fasciclin domain-containing protein n=1 Tax=Terrimonas pollutisoli TaxID=3034147 RepID=UPI0023EC6E2C|nr:fasciclin domain-containing protein [Terrimonas sp. H1YJ31]
MKKILSGLMAVMMVALVLFSCKKRDDYLTGGSRHSAKFNVTTYDFLKGQASGLFDTLLLLVDKTGLKDKLNQQGVSFFAPTDYAINNYLNQRALQEQNIDPKRKWTLDSMIKYELPKFTDSLDTYIVGQTLDYNNLTNNGAIYPTKKAGTEAVVSYEEITPDNSEYIRLGGNPNVSSNPRLIYYTFLKGPLTPPVIASEITPAGGTRVRVQTSGIQTNTGMVHVLINQHILFFRQ